nr:DUF1761 domain-containing protein [uncultured Flavobacterium sp.]
MNMNFLAILVAAVATFPVGFIWYNPKVFGTIWMREAGVNPDAPKNANMIKIFGLTFVFAIMLGFILQFLTIHQFGASGMIGGPRFLATAKPSYAAFMADYSHAYRTFKHGALHGFMTGLFLALPMIGINAQFEGKSWKYILINAGYFTVCFTIMGGIICAWE